MNKNVPFLTKEYIERDAATLLFEYEQARGVVIAPPVPIEDIVEKHQKISIEFDDTHRLFDVPRSGAKPDILGAIFLNEPRIVIDESLDPEEYPAKEGQYRFTLGHEGGHWRLHRHLVDKNQGPSALFQREALPSFNFASSKTKTRMEWQADFYSSCLLMPPDLVLAAWNRKFPDGRPRFINPSLSARRSFVKVPLEILCDDYGPIWSETVDEALDRIARPFAEAFLVSTTAMRIRLEDLGLLLRKVP
ncbi:ImmA/IrrE family metallo-endopeptidase [Nitrosospira multiformis]|jgi:Zn-dependent peptidase ImmA (M78 family)|uniref:IrrE N-terminal-like domain-containing protein n=1 Tax=Nitrosospira multiformis TaxID=1231 RepID=A0A1I7HI81_9PROT|nr:ImmA/IrrE family metallo-endopeptidase [Nitrosospira multiformis]SFU60418.1 protein of unknown function [Nitrosospira multiformis]